MITTQLAVHRWRIAPRKLPPIIATMYIILLFLGPAFGLFQLLNRY